MTLAARVLAAVGGPGGLARCSETELAAVKGMGIAKAGDWPGLLIALPVLVAKLGLAGAGLAVIETVSAKMRIFRAPEFLGTAFVFAVLAMLVHVLLEG